MSAVAAGTFPALLLKSALHLLHPGLRRRRSALKHLHDKGRAFSLLHRAAISAGLSRMSAACGIKAPGFAGQGRSCPLPPPEHGPVSWCISGHRACFRHGRGAFRAQAAEEAASCGCRAGSCIREKPRHRSLRGHSVRQGSGHGLSVFCRRACFPLLPFNSSRRQTLSAKKRSPGCAGRALFPLMRRFPLFFPRRRQEGRGGKQAGKGAFLCTDRAQEVGRTLRRNASGRRGQASKLCRFCPAGKPARRLSPALFGERKGGKFSAGAEGRPEVCGPSP